MHAILFAPLRALFWAIGSLPYPLLYALSDGLAFVLHRVVGYRKAVILGQLEACFPDQDAAWRKQVATGFYRHLTDLMLEAFKFPHMDLAARADRIKTENLEALAPLARQDRSCIIVLGHLGNWEWGASGATDLLTHGVRLHVVYKRPKNPELEKWLKQTREMHGLRLVPMKEVDSYITHHRSIVAPTPGSKRPPGQEPFALTLIADQTPSNPNRAVWTTFMGRDTPVFYGPERLARMFNLPVFYLACERTGRGRYRYVLHELFLEPRQAPDGAITKAHLRKLEQGIRQHPETWLWSHKRWKHHKPEGAHELA